MSTPYIGSKISLISRLDIRYEGTLHSVDPVDSTISLSQVRSFGTEDRPAPVQVPARDQVYEFIIFKAADIKDLIVCETPKPVPSVDDITYDPAIVSISKPPTQGPRQPAPQQAAIDERSSAQDNSQASSPPHQIVPMQQPQRQQQQYVGQLMGNFGQNIQRSYYNRTMNQQPAQHQQYNNPPPRAYPAHQYRLPPPPIPPQYDLQQGQIRRGGHFNNNQQRQAQQPRPYHNHQQRNNQPPPAGPRFDGDFDFERANEQFRESVGDIAEKMAAAGLEDLQSKSNRSSARNSEERAAERIVAEKPPARDENYYDKNLSFFDNISCEALEKEEGKNNRVDWKKERMTNQETFGNTAVRSHNYRRGGRGGGYGGQGYQHRGYYNNYHNNQQQGGGGQGYQRGGTRYYGGGGGRPQQQQEQNY